LGKYIKMNRRLYIFFVLVAAITTTIAVGNYTTIRADTTSGDPVDLANALATAPRGLDISDPTFQLGKFYKTIEKTDTTTNITSDIQVDANSAKVIKRNQDDNDKTGILRVTNDFNQLGAIWSNIDEANYIDITRDQTMSMWLYFGRPIDKTKLAEVGDGMAFVLQNDERGKNAISTKNEKNSKGQDLKTPMFGETLGVWGADFDNFNDKYLPVDIAATGIQNSYAIEFDTFADRLSKYIDVAEGKGVSFDKNIQINPHYDYNGLFQHIGMNYPGEPETYIRQSSGENDSVHYFTMNHGYEDEGVDIANKDKLSEMRLTDANWHHMTVKFEHGDSRLSFDYDDKKLDGTYKLPKKSVSVKLKMRNFNLGNKKKLRWGFTGSTGRFMENNLIVFESIPSFVSADTSASIKNVTKNYTIADGDHVDIGDDLDFTYNLNYESGSKEWSKILASMNLPAEVTFKSGSVIYNDSNGNSEKIPLSEFSNNNVEHVLLKNLSENNKKATIVLHTTVNDVKEKTTVGEAVAKFSSDNFIINDKTPNFIIDVNELNICTDPSEPVNYDSIDKVLGPISVKGEIGYSKIPTINPSTIKVKSSFNGGTEVTTSATGSIGATAPFSLSIDRSKVHVGQNTLTLYGIDNTGKRTKEVTIIFNVGGGLSFGNVSPGVFFKDVNMGYKGEIVTRKPGWQIEVIDGRSNQKGWTLQAKASPLVDDKTSSQLIGEVVHRDDNGMIAPLLDWTNIYSHKKSTDSVETFDVANAWTQNNGVLLQLNGKNMAGVYSGKVEWNLVDSI